MEENYITNKSWMYKYKTKQERFNTHFLAGVEQFMQFASRNMNDVGSSVMKCPCFKCENKFYLEKGIVHYHIVREGFTQRYTTWHFHGESHKDSQEDDFTPTNSNNDMARILNDAFMRESIDDDAHGQEQNQGMDKFKKLMEEAKKPLYAGCNKYSRLSFIVRLFQLKCLHKWSNKSFSAMLALFKDALPTDNTLPNSWYESKKMMSQLGLNCKKIHACPNDCVLFRNEYKDFDKCPRCNACRWKGKQNNGEEKKNVPVKILRHFPLIPRLQRLFMSEKTANLMTWHHTAPEDENGKMSHPRDSIAWKDFDQRFPSFSHDPRNIRLGLASDGFSPFNELGVECPLQPSNEVRDGNAEEILESNSSHVEVSTTSTNFKVRKTRGPTSKSASNPPKGQKWRCMFIDQQPVGEEASKLAEVLGLYARNDNYFPPHKEWKEQSKQSFNDVMKEILVEYDFVDKEGLPASMTYVTKFCETSISSKVKEWRAALKRAGYMKGVDGELSETPPNERISEASWNSLLQYWSNPKKIQEIERNRKNRAEEQAIHTLGAKSIARHNHEQRQKLGDNYSTLGAYLTAHQIKGGEYPNEYTRDICEKVIAICEERNIGNSLEPTVLAPVLDDVYNGHHGGYERGRGIGWSRGAWKYNMSNEVSNDNIRRLTTDLENTQSKLQNAMAEIEGMRAHESEMKERQEEHMEAMLARERGLEVRLQEQEEAMQAREQEMQAQLKQMEAMVSMCLSNASVGERRLHNAHASSSQPPRK